MLAEGCEIFAQFRLISRQYHGEMLQACRDHLALDVRCQKRVEPENADGLASGPASVR